LKCLDANPIITNEYRLLLRLFSGEEGEVRGIGTEEEKHDQSGCQVAAGSKAELVARSIW
jgi:hypothetical protein